MGPVDLDDGLNDTLLDILQAEELLIQDPSGLCRINGLKIRALPFDVQHHGEAALGMPPLLRADGHRLHQVHIAVRPGADGCR